MSWVCRSVLVAIVALSYFVHKQFQVIEITPLENRWWGRGLSSHEPLTITNKQIDYPQNAIDDLKFRLQHTKPFFPSLEGVKQHYGIHTKVLQNVLEYWTNQYNWTERQQFLNQYVHRFVKIRGLNVHFLHIKPEHNNESLRVVPLMMVHGWLGSFREFYEVIPKLTQLQNGRNFALELIIPSLPGFAFSEAAAKTGLSAAYMAQIFVDLMDILGFEKYFVYGGDWGSHVVNHLAARHPEKVIGMHSTFCFHGGALTFLMFLVGHIWPSLIYEENEMKLCNSKQNTLKFLLEESGYFHIQATKPDTVGVGLTESPMGLAAYMLEKIISITNPDFRDLEDGGLTRKYSMEQLLDTITIYWLTGTITSSMRIYAEAFTNADLEFRQIHEIPITVPVGCARFAYELFLTPHSILKRKYHNLVHLTQYDTGGHFAALEEPDLFAQDLLTFIDKVLSVK